MTGWNPARLLAPIALVVTAVALFAILAGGGENGGEAPADGATTAPTATATPASRRDSGQRRPSRRSYTVKPGDTPSSIAEKVGIPLDDLLDLNPDADPQSLNPGDKLRLR